MSSVVVRSHSTIDAEWLTHVLRSNGSLSDGHVECVDVAPMVFSGAVAELSRLTPQYSNDDTRLPGQQLLKVTKEDLHPEHLAKGRREVEFYGATM
ncbi:MAG: hypothetical protein HOM68_03035 [Gemmatimonadetes bacterium]|jgi:hypothetical protein|nr:hypothetical protein [Gemmatimonadota bacterium]MBT4610291.1 hypothetical protein [Gemmatimonadota bacterium]MBT5055493.1 hypothetical protein [Gemmatimonadota bacterium]MBT5143368.1 hypothetical protein [Gemmatimonadota bacterium]MBT5586698.1 hypothetical protein [Gemmatimonadota bacterium]